MTREEAIKVLETERAWIKTLYEVSNLIVTAYKASFIEAFDMAIEALQERPKGRWIERSYQHHYYTDIIFTTYECPFCGKVQSLKEPYCTCGADMRESEE